MHVCDVINSFFVLPQAVINLLNVLSSFPALFEVISKATPTSSLNTGPMTVSVRDDVKTVCSDDSLNPKTLLWIGFAHRGLVPSTVFSEAGLQ